MYRLQLHVSLQRYLSPAIICAAVCSISCSFALAQDTSTTDQLDTSAAADDTSGGAPTTENKPAAAAFHAVFEEWKRKLGQLREIQMKYSLAEDDELDGIREQWNQLIEACHELAPGVTAQALAAFEESPGEDRELVRFLITVIADDVKKEKYAEAYELASGLLEGGADERGLNDLAGIGAFGSNQFDEAEQYLTEANARGSLSQQGSNFYSVIADVKAAWEEEQKIREAEAAADDLPRVKLETSEGDIVLELFENEAPETVGNFISLVELGFYDGLKFHRVLDGFMAQLGCPNGDGSGGPGYNIYCECVNDNHRKHFAGSVSMAKEAARNTGGSQFFLNFVPASHLNGRHTVFGRVLEGMDTLARIHKVDPSDSKSTAIPSKVVKAEVVRKRDHEYRPNKVK